MAQRTSFYDVVTGPGGGQCLGKVRGAGVKLND